ncbi:hypothetical protein ACET3Z_002332 [Daucus carota]
MVGHSALFTRIVQVAITKISISSVNFEFIELQVLIIRGFIKHQPLEQYFIFNRFCSNPDLQLSEYRLGESKFPTCLKGHAVNKSIEVNECQESTTSMFLSAFSRSTFTVFIKV